LKIHEMEREREGGELVEDPLAEWAGMPEFEQKNIAHRSIIVHFETQEAVEAFEKLVEQELPTGRKFIWYPEAEEDRIMHLRWSSKEDGDASQG